MSKCESVQDFDHLFIYVLPLEIQLSRGKSWDSIKQFNSATFLCLSQDRIWISNVICLIFVFNELKLEAIVRFIDIGGTVDHHSSKFLFIKYG